MQPDPFTHDPTADDNLPGYDPALGAVNVGRALSELEAAARAYDLPMEALVTLSLERNSRGATWKVTVSDTGVPLIAALEKLDQAVAAMAGRYGGIKPEA